MSAESDPFVAYHQGLARTHAMIAGALRFVAVPPEATSVEELVPRATAAAQFLHGHHHAESAILFPGLRKHGTGRSSDVAFLDACDRAHDELHALCERLLATAGAPHPVHGEVTKVAAEVLARLEAHVAEEEAGLAPENLRAMISLPAFEEIGRELVRLRGG